MNRHWLDARIWLPLAVAVACFALREAGAAPSTAPARVRALDLPPLYGMPVPTVAVSYELDAAQSSVRFLVTGSHGQLLVACPAFSGRLSFAAGTRAGAAGELELRLDLASLQRLEQGSPAIDLPHVLGVHRNSEVVFRARLAASTTSDLPGVTQRTWLGTLHFGARVLRQPMLLWQCSLPGRALRLQGHGPVDAAAFGLPKRRSPWLLSDRPDVTLGLDLAWRRSRDG